MVALEGAVSIRKGAARAFARGLIASRIDGLPWAPIPACLRLRRPSAFHKDPKIFRTDPNDPAYTWRPLHTFFLLRKRDGAV